MADEKPGDKKPDKPAPAPAHKDPFVEIVSIGVALLLVLYILNGIFLGLSGLFAHGWKGLTPEGIILSHTRPIASLNNPFSAQVVTLNDTAVFNDAGGRQVGSQKFNARGKILQGPVTVDGVTYYYVDFDTGSDGWVKSNDIGYLESEPTVPEQVLIWLFSVVSFLHVLSLFISIFIILSLAYIVRKLSGLRQAQRNLMYPAGAVLVNEPGFAPVVSAPSNPKWDRVLDHVESANENDWRQAIVECDVMLESLLDTLSLPGDTMADKMKAVEKSDFTTINLAWEAHKIRNQIAHEGSDFALTHREARRVIDLYRQIFEEFQLI